MDIHQAGANVGALGIDDLTALGDGRGAHFAVACDLAVFDEQHCLGNQMIPHDQLCIDNCFHGKFLLKFALRLS